MLKLFLYIKSKELIGADGNIKLFLYINFLYTNNDIKN
jgi:hypothetical protein